MGPEVLGWAAKVEGDFLTAQRGYRARKSPNYDSVCFHAQQRIEKYMKARLVEVGIHFSKTHDLGLLLDLLYPVESMWESFRLSLNRVSYYAVGFRYPGEFASKDDAAGSLITCCQLHRMARQSLGLPE